MAMQISNWLSGQILNSVLRGIPFTPPSAIYIALYTSDPTAADTGAEVVGGGYVRQRVIYTPPTIETMKQTVKNTDIIEFPIASADWGLVTHVALRTAITGGNMLWSNALSNPRTVEVGDRPKFLKDAIFVRFAQ